MRRFRYLDALTTTFVVILLVSNLVAQKVVRIPLFSFHGHPLAFSTSGAMLLFPITYIFGDIFTEIYGYAASRRAIWLGFFGTALLYAVSAIVIALPSDPEFKHQQAFVTVFGILPRILIASLMAFWAGEFANSYTMAKLKLITRGRWLWTRTVGSTVVGQAVDTTLVIIITFAGTFTPGQALSDHLAGLPAEGRVRGAGNAGDVSRRQLAQTRRARRYLRHAYQLQSVPVPEARRRSLDARTQR